MNRTKRTPQIPKKTVARFWYMRVWWAAMRQKWKKSRKLMIQ